MSGEQVFPLVLVTLKIGQGVGENLLQVAILDNCDGFACKNHESENDETCLVDLLPAFFLPGFHATSCDC